MIFSDFGWVKKRLLRVVAGLAGRCQKGGNCGMAGA